MNIAIGKKSKNHHDLIIVTPQSKLTGTLHTFVKETLEIKKDAQFRVGYLPTVQGKNVAHTIIVQLRDPKKFNEYAEDVIADIGWYIKKLDTDFFVNLDTSWLSKEDAKLFGELAMTSLYGFSKYKKSNKIKGSLTIQSKHIDAKKFTHLTNTFTMTKDLVNDPSQSVTPASFEKHVRQLFAKEKNIKVTVFDHKDLVKKWMMGIYEVGKGSECPPRLVLIEYTGSKKKWYDIGLVGKGVCFDSGGYNLKPSGHIEDMKIDMAGGATVLWILHYAVKTGIKKNIIVWIPMVENLVSHNAFKPGEIITMYNGKTVEIGNTDAEWRLILADTLSYVEEKYEPEYVFDFATLTGAQVVATGSTISVILWRNSKLNQQLQTRSFTLKDRVRELPYFEPYLKRYKSEVADMNNISTSGWSGPGTITAGLFLGEFIKMQNWIHFDIAGPAHKPSDPLTGHGATACMIRLIVDFLEK